MKERPTSMQTEGLKIIFWLDSTRALIDHLVRVKALQRVFVVVVFCQSDRAHLPVCPSLTSKTYKTSLPLRYLTEIS